ncbi:hypothetical protein MADA3029_740052 [Vibrio nigripulchritudo MADA3029]|uniref:hypothetical protein n=1 Tax=Vibrio nigripulchritudo TaxID=28173 RepID=UPI0003B22406|nr:hypothetical protein [Vibrio nigripulchritudo]CCN46007.1 hypothetical protein VIBNIMADA3020_1180037 [Vibrio nigripulchritudo MADA3020]CCN54131.1 hypothetical protein VIBNIMADA3021_510054 [Vibrio nigripulchritudo MADA3021]CCN61201.1 hypothetical protein MADA3029_740052 [Vibrio nigripulchritudo MADA3029]
MKKSTIEIIRDVARRFEKELKQKNINDFVLVSHTNLKPMRNVLTKLGYTTALYKTKPTNRYIHKGFSQALYEELQNHSKSLNCKSIQHLNTEYVNSKIVRLIRLQNFTEKSELTYLNDISFSSRKLSQFLVSNGFTNVDPKNKNKSFISVDLKHFIEKELIKDEIFKELFFTQTISNNKEEY